MKMKHHSNLCTYYLKIIIEKWSFCSLYPWYYLLMPLNRCGYLFNDLHWTIRMAKALWSPVITIAMTFKAWLRWNMSQTLWYASATWLLLQSIRNRMIVLTMQITPREIKMTHKHAHTIERNLQIYTCPPTVDRNNLYLECARLVVA